MKLATFLGPDGGAPRIGSVYPQDLTIIDLQLAYTMMHGQPNAAFDDMLALMDAGDQGLEAAHAVCQANVAADARLALDSVRLLSPVPEPRQIRDCNNFEQHMRDAPKGMQRLKARLAGTELSEGSITPTAIAPVNFRHVVFYISNRFNVVGPDAEVEWPPYSEWFDYEGEFGIFIGTRGKNIPRERAAEHIFGYSVFNDFSARDQQAGEMEGRMGPTKGKSFDTGNAIGPWIVTRDEVPDPRDMHLTVRINGEVRASSSTSGMIHSFEDIVTYLSQSETLHPGEFIGSGTVGGCCGLETDQWLRDGDVVEIEVDRIGILRNRVVRRTGA